MDNELYHYGILGMHWGVRRYQNKDGTLTAEGKRRVANSSNEKSNNSKSSTGSTTQRKSVKNMTDDELRAEISRLELEKKYKELLRSETSKKKMFDGKKFVIGVLESSGKNIATQATTYALGSLVNKAAGTNVVNPKKGQTNK